MTSAARVTEVQPSERTGLWEYSHDGLGRAEKPKSETSVKKQESACSLP